MGDTVPFELIRKASEGDSEVFEQVFSPLLEPAYYLALGLLQDRELAEEAVIRATQQAFASLGDVRAGTSLRKWFVSIVLRQCRSAKPLEAVVPETDELDATKTSDELLGEALMALRYQDRCILIMHHYVDLPIDEVAQLEGLSMEATRGRLDKTMTKLGPLFADNSGWFRLDEMVIAKRLHDLIDGIGPPSPDFWDKIRKALAKPPTRRDRLQGVIAVCAALLAVAVVLTIPAGFKNYTHTKAVLQQQAPPLIADLLKESPIPLPSPLQSLAAAPEPSPQDSPTQAAKKSPAPRPGGGQPPPTDNPPPPPPDPGNPSITTASLPNGEATVAYATTQLAASGGSGSGYSYSAVSGLPNGSLNVQGNGLITGTPSSACAPCTFTIRVTDSNGRSSNRSFTPTLYPALGMNSPAFHAGEVGVVYSPTVQLTAAGTGSGTYTWQVMAPAGLTTGPTGGTTFSVGGTAPTATGPITVKVSDPYTSVTRTFTSIVPHVTLAAQTLPKGRSVPPTSYPQSGPPVVISVTGGTGVGPFTYSLNSGALPTGLSLNSSTGAITGTTTLAGTYDFTIKVTDSLGATDTRPYQIQVTTTGT